MSSPARSSRSKPTSTSDPALDITSVDPARDEARYSAGDQNCVTLIPVPHDEEVEVEYEDEELAD